jgi:hypothetical protein
MHTEESRSQQKSQWEQLSAGERGDLERDIGIDTWNHGFTGVPTVPQSCPSRIAPFDFMHCTAEGQWKHEVAAFLHVAI